jgi:translation initiation factor IF-3
VNNRIRVPEVRVIGPDGTQLGIMPTSQAMKIAEEAGLDLVEVSPKAVPPVCRIMDYGKFKYEQSKQQARAKKHQSTVILKEVKFRPKTDDHDFDFKVRHIRRFLQEGNKAKLVIIFRGREIVHPETGQAMLKAVTDACADIAVIEQNPTMEGRRMLMVIAPKSGVIKSAVPQPAPTAGGPGRSGGGEDEGPRPAPATTAPAMGAPAAQPAVQRAAAPAQPTVTHKAPARSSEPKK